MVARVCDTRVWLDKFNFDETKSKKETYIESERERYRARGRGETFFCFKFFGHFVNEQRDAELLSKNGWKE